MREIRICAAVVGRFYGGGLPWALALPLPELFGWRGLVPAVRKADPVGSAVWLMKPPNDD